VKRKHWALLIIGLAIVAAYALWGHHVRRDTTLALSALSSSCSCVGGTTFQQISMSDTLWYAAIICFVIALSYLIVVR
jgi:hypothetical protein